MRISNLSIAFHDGSRVLEGYTTPGWYLSAADEDAEGHLWAIRPVKITPAVAEEIAMSIAQSANVQAAFNGIHNQNVHARNEAKTALDRADTLAADARRKAEQLAEWERVVGEDAGDSGQAQHDG